MTARRLAALDLGTNSARLLVADAAPDGALHLVVDERIPCRLGQELTRSGCLHPEAQARAEGALAALVERARQAGAERVCAAGTYALRAAADGPEFVTRMRARLELEMRLLTGEEEAQLVLRGARRHVSPPAWELLVCLDLGAGSLELARDDPSGPRLVSLPLGPVAIAGELADPPPPAALEKLRGRAARLLDECAVDFAGSSTQPAAAGGTVTTLARLSGTRGPLSGTRLGSGEIEVQLRRLASLDLETRRRLPGLPPDRADIIVPGLVVLGATLHFLGAASLRVHEHGVREGIILAMLQGEM